LRSLARAAVAACSRRGCGRQRPRRRAFASARAGRAGGEEDIAAQLGVGAAAADAELDALKEAAEGEILAPGGVVGRYAPLVAAFCHSRRGRAPPWSLERQASQEFLAGRASGAAARAAHAPIMRRSIQHGETCALSADCGMNACVPDVRPHLRRDGCCLDATACRACA
jgi:hypothetical protein